MKKRIKCKTKEKIYRERYTTDRGNTKDWQKLVQWYFE